MLVEALTDQDRKDRQIRKRLSMMVNSAIIAAQYATPSENYDDGNLAMAVSGPKRLKSSAGDLVYSAPITQDITDEESTHFCKEVVRQMKRAGVEVTCVRRGDAFRVTVDRGYMAANGGSHKMAVDQELLLSGGLAEASDEAEKPDVSKSITTKGSTKGALPKSNAAKAQDKREKSDSDEDEEEIDPDDDENIFKESRIDFGQHGRSAATSRIETGNISRRVTGQVRRIPRAKLLWKEKGEAGTFTERWMYLAQSIDDIVSIKRRILSETDIPVDKTLSPSGDQGFAMEQFGDLVFLTISGLKS